MDRRPARNVPRALVWSAMLLGGVAACHASAAGAGGRADPRAGEAGAVVPVDSTTLRHVLAIDEALLAAEERRDTAAMHRQYAPDYYAVAPDGEMLGVRARLFRVAVGFRAMDSAQVLTAPWVRQVGPTAVVVTRSTRLWGHSHGAPVEGLALRVTRLYVDRGEGWRLLFQQGTPLAAEHVPGTGPGAPPH